MSDEYMSYRLRKLTAAEQTTIERMKEAATRPHPAIDNCLLDIAPSMDVRLTVKVQVEVKDQ